MVIWNSEVAEDAVKALASPPLNRQVNKEHVHPLPIFKVSPFLKTSQHFKVLKF
jgi:hypothetical protein